MASKKLTATALMAIISLCETDPEGAMAHEDWDRFVSEYPQVARKYKIGDSRTGEGRAPRLTDMLKSVQHNPVAPEQYVAYRDAAYFTFNGFGRVYKGSEETPMLADNAVDVLAFALSNLGKSLSGILAVSTNGDQTRILEALNAGISDLPEAE